MLARALRSVMVQTHPVAAVAIAVDHRREGAASNRQRALDTVRTPWVAFLDDDDEWLPQHVEKLLRLAKEEDADYVWGWFNVIGGTDPFPGHFGKQWDPEDPHQTTITTLVRTELAQQVGFLKSYAGATPDGNRSGEDWSFTNGCSEAGAKMVHLPERTWNWHHTGHNTSGLPSRW